MNRFTLLACAALCAAFLTGCKKPDPVAAVVNGEAISMDDYQHYLEIKPQIQVIVDPSRLQSSGAGQVPQQPYVGQVVGSIGLQALTDLVQKTLLKQLARDEGVYPTDQQVQTELDDRQKVSPNFVRELTNAGFSLAAIRSDIAVQLCQFNLVTKGVTVSDDEVSKYIAENPKDFIVPEAVEMTWLLVADDKNKGLADAELKSGRDFALVAKTYSVAPNADADGNRFQGGTIAVPQLAGFGPDLAPAVNKIIDPAQLAQHALPQQTGWIKFKEGWAKFSVNRKIDSRKLPQDDALRTRVKKSLLIQRGSQGKDLDEQLRDKLKAATIEVGIPHLKETFETRLKALKAGTVPTAAATDATTGK